VSRWQRYWFAEGGRSSVAMLRIGIAIAVGMSLWRLWHLPQLVAAPSVYRPVGIWMLLGDTPPPHALVALLWGLAVSGTLAMLVGLWSRAATAVSFGASVALASLSFSGSLTWSHQYNVVFLAQLAFLGARGGDTLSVDAWWRRARGLPALNVPRGYLWSVRLVTLAVALMFVSAAFIKLGNARFTLNWALTDNLRHQLLVRYDLTGIERPALVDWLLAEAWRYKTAAVLNLVAQLSPLLAIIFVRRPFVRAFAGALFVVEVLGLWYVMMLWNLHWLPLAAVYVDWDRLFGMTRRRPEPRPPAPTSALPAWRVRAFVLAFVIYDVATAFIPKIDQQLNTYPFSSFPMFSKVRAAKPYDQHLPYAVAGDHYEAISDRPLDRDAQRWLDYGFRNLHAVKDPDVLRARLANTLARAQRQFPQYGIRGLRHWLAIFEAPAYPGPARFDIHPIAITGELLPDGTFRSALGRFTKSGVELRAQNLDARDATLVIYEHDRPVATPLAATRTGDVFAPAPAGDPVYVVARIGEQPWLVASKRTWRFQ